MNDHLGVEYDPEPEIPEGFDHLWSFWWQLNSRRQPGFESVTPISWTEICSWAVLTGTQIMPEEVALLVRMDDEFLSVVAEERKAQREREKDQSNDKGKR